MILPPKYFQQSDVVYLAKDLIGKVLFTSFNGEITAIIITETEAYEGITDKASHAYGNRFTNRTKTMFKAGGIAYIYLIYGIHSLFNIVTNVENVPHAVLIRSGIPFLGQNIMEKRNQGKGIDLMETTGPGRLSKLMGIKYQFDGIILGKSDDSDCIWIEDLGFSKSTSPLIEITARIGIDYAEDHKLLPYRFVVPTKQYKKLQILKKI